LTGTVTSSEGQRIADAILQFLDGPNTGVSTTTNGNGEYRFDNVERGNANLSATAAGFRENRAGVFVDGTNTLNFVLQRFVPQGAFGPGSHLVGTEIMAGRYFATPAPGCEWRRFSSTGAVTANEIVVGEARQIIVDILASDTRFQTNDQCGAWFDSPPHGTQDQIHPGTWLVNTQIAPGQYQSEGAGCSWVRLSRFIGDTGDTIAFGEPPGSGPHTVTISGSDAGFRSSPECAPWQRVP
jgi:hypothetical protein